MVTRTWTPRYEKEWSTPGLAINRYAARPGELRKASRWTSKELSLSQGALAFTGHERLAAVVVRKKQLWFSRPIHPGDETNLSSLVAQLLIAAAKRPQRTRWRPRLYSVSLMLSLSVLVDTRVMCAVYQNGQRILYSLVIRRSLVYNPYIVV